MTYKKKLIEVALPLEAISASCKADKDRKTGTIRNLHKWFSPMPPPAWRALIFAAMVDDPGDESARDRLFDIIEGLAPEDGTRPTDAAVSRARDELRNQWGPDLPTVVDPFCGGGSTLIEARRLDMPSIGSDLNPVPALITRVLTDLVPAVRGIGPFGAGAQALLTSEGSLAGFIADVRHYADRVQREAKDRIGSLYPPAPNGDTVIAWRWARCVPSPDPQYEGAPTPLVSSWWMSKRKGERSFMVPLVNRSERTIEFNIQTNGEAPAPSSKHCLLSGAAISFSYLKEQGRAGHLQDMLLAIAADGLAGRTYYAPTEEHVRAADVHVDGTVADVPLPDAGLGFRVQAYGITRWKDLFTPRQLMAMQTFSDLVAESSGWVTSDGAPAHYAKAVASVLGLCVGKLAQSSSRQVRWRLDSRNGSAKAEPAFARHDLAPIWDFVEVNPFGGSVGDWVQQVETALRAFDWVDHQGPRSQVHAMDARELADHLPDGVLVATDPPYFSYIGYADLSDYFYVWLRRSLRDVHPDLFATIRAPRSGEVIADPARHNGDRSAAAEYFILTLTEVFERLSRKQHDDLPMLIVYAYRQQETGADSKTGWEAVLEALLAANLTVVGTWPIHGTGSSRQRGQNSNALATYSLLVCRPRSKQAPLATRREFQAALRQELATAIATLTSTSIAPSDLAQAVIGPGMAVFSRHAKVVEADGSPMTVRTALGLVNRTLDEIVEAQDSEFDADTRWAVAWFEQFGVSQEDFGIAEALARAKVTSINGLVESGILHARAGKVRLLRRDELRDDWDPREDSRLTVWEVVQHLVRSHEAGGEQAAARLLSKLGGGLGEVARDLAYRLYLVCEKRGWGEEGQPYNALAAAWPDISRLSTQTSGPVRTQASLDV